MEQNRISLKNLDTCKATLRTSSANIRSRSSYLLNVTSPPFSSARFTLNTETCTHYSWSSAVWVITMHATCTLCMSLCHTSHYQSCTMCTWHSHGSFVRCFITECAAHAHWLHMYLTPMLSLIHTTHEASQMEESCIRATFTVNFLHSWHDMTNTITKIPKSVCQVTLSFKSIYISMYERGEMAAHPAISPNTR